MKTKTAKLRRTKLVGQMPPRAGKRSTADNPIFCDQCGEVIAELPYYAIHSRCCSRECQQKVFRGAPSKIKQKNKQGEK